MRLIRGTTEYKEGERLGGKWHEMSKIEFCPKCRGLSERMETSEGALLAERCKKCQYIIIF